jgi:regulator of replication initiation timing
VAINGAAAGILVLSELVKQLRSVNENLEGIVAHVVQLGIEARQLREVLEIQGVGGITGI